MRTLHFHGVRPPNKYRKEELTYAEIIHHLENCPLHQYDTLLSPDKSLLYELNLVRSDLENKEERITLELMCN